MAKMKNFVCNHTHVKSDNGFTPKTEAERLIKRFRTFLNYDLTLIKEFQDPSSKNIKYHNEVTKNAKKLALIVLDEMYSIITDEDIDKFMNQLKEEIEKY